MRGLLSSRQSGSVLSSCTRDRVSKETGQRGLLAGLIFAVLILILPACARQDTFEKSRRLQVPGPISAQVDPRLLTLQESSSLWDSSKTYNVGQALSYVVKPTPNATVRLSYMASHLEVDCRTIMGIALYDPDLCQAAYYLSVQVEQNGFPQVVDASGRARSGATSARAARDAIELAVLDFHRKVSAMLAR